MLKSRVKELSVLSAKARLLILEAVFSAKSGHPGGSLSIADILTYLYNEEMRVKPNEPKWEDRDRFVLSKGHASPAIYSVLSLKGFFSTDEIKNFRNIGSFLQGHPDMKGVSGVDMSTGSLGQGVSAACGMALSAKLSKKENRVYSILGDGELEEGQVWEAAMFAAHYKLDNLCIFIDLNGLQIDGDIRKVMSPYPVDEKFKAFGFNVMVIDGHNFDEIENAVMAAKAEKGRPTAIIANCIKGKGVSFMENDAGWHGNAPNAEQYEKAVSEVTAQLKSLEG
jgi:transketolase